VSFEERRIEVDVTLVIRVSGMFFECGGRATFRKKCQPYQDKNNEKEIDFAVGLGSRQITLKGH